MVHFVCKITTPLLYCLRASGSLQPSLVSHIQANLPFCTMLGYVSHDDARNSQPITDPFKDIRLPGRRQDYVGSMAILSALRGSPESFTEHTDAPLRYTPSVPFHKRDTNKTVYAVRLVLLPTGCIGLGERRSLAFLPFH